MDGAALPEEDTPRWSVEEEMSNQLMSWSLEEASCWVAPFGDTGDQLYGMGLPGQGTKTEKQEDKQVETEPWTLETAVNTEENWESLMKSVGDYSAQLSLRYEALHKEQEVEQVKDESQMKLLELKREDAIRQQQALIDKMESLQVKLKLNCYKTTRKNFSAKKAELSEERDRLKEDANRLSVELEDADKKLASLVKEQTEESDTLQREIADLHKEMNRLQKGYEEASQAALKDEISAVEMQREASISQVEEWLASAQRYLDMLRRSDASHQNMQRRLEWEKKVAAARSSLGNLQRSFNEQLQFLRQGEQLDSLVPVTLPSLPHIPSLEFQMGLPASFAPMHMPPVFIPSPAIVLQPHFPSAATNSSHARSNSKSGTPAHQPVASTVPHTTLLNKLNTPSRPLSPAKPAPVAQPASAPADTAQPAGLLDKLLEKLGARFPHCSRNQLMSALQQIKSARGTMAGLSIEDLTQQVAQRLAQTEKPALGPIGPLQHAQRPTRPTQGSAAAHVFDIRTSQNVTSNSRKLCLMCQNQVEAGTQHNMSCSHIVHKECISLWLQSSKNNSCPFCPSK
ncbi:RING finger protein 214 [Scleropages formosus]|uniref:RING-type domain-containing protein n=1 Tax=Scleropages formosus TaxID=113540 RepID=A0A8C9R146_SCLFO|nr:RING finger protein 214 [Scleropages formosus]XP_029106593.1 RING finger protein 214 [Scleropages formosus]